MQKKESVKCSYYGNSRCILDIDGCSGCSGSSRSNGNCFYINGVETFRTSFGGVSQNEEYLILSVEMKGENGVPEYRDASGEEAEFIVDYVKAYQYK